MPCRDATELFFADARAAAVRAGVEPPKTLVIRKRKHPSSELAKLAQALMESIEQCQRAILDRAPQYLSRSAGMSVQEKDQSDNFIRNNIKAIHLVVQKLDLATNDTGDTSDLMKHHQGQVRVAQEFAKDAVNMFSEQKTYRKQQADLFKRPTASSVMLPQDLTDGAAPAAPADSQGDQEQILEEENAALLREMQCLNSQVDDVKRKLMEISELSSLFNTEVPSPLSRGFGCECCAVQIIRQHDTIDTMHEHTEVATHNMVEGNSNLEQATKDGFGTRLMMVIFLLVASACILFLDWYQ